MRRPGCSGSLKLAAQAHRCDRRGDDGFREGSTVRTRRDFVLRVLGDEGWERVLQNMSEAHRSHWSLSVLASAWYPTSAVAALEEAIVHEFGDDPITTCNQLGAFSAEQNLPSTYKSFFPQGRSPAAFFEKLLSLYPSLYDFGKAWIDGTTEIGTELVHDFDGHATRTNCLTARSFFERAGTMAGIAGLRVHELSCQAKGSELCIYGVGWERVQLGDDPGPTSKL